MWVWKLGNWSWELGGGGGGGAQRSSHLATYGVALSTCRFADKSTSSTFCVCVCVCVFLNHIGWNNHSRSGCAKHICRRAQGEVEVVPVVMDNCEDKQLRASHVTANKRVLLVSMHNLTNGYVSQPTTNRTSTTYVPHALRRFVTWQLLYCHDNLGLFSHLEFSSEPSAAICI